MANRIATLNFRNGNIAKILFGLTLVPVILLSSVAPSYAGRFAVMHPRRAQLNGRFAQLNTRMSNSYGQLGGQYGHLQGQSNAIQTRMHQDVQANGGYLTRAQQRQFGRQYRSLAQQVTADQALGAPSGQFAQNNPYGAQVTSGASNLNQQLSNGYGNLQGHYIGLEHRDNAIRAAAIQQMQTNGGDLTQQQQQRFDNREANLQNSINQYSGQ